jgi:hypothetical protein
MEIIYRIVDFLSYVYRKFRIKKSYYSISFLYGTFLFREAFSRIDFFSKFFHELSINTENSFLFWFYSTMEIILKFEISNLIFIVFTIYFLLNWYLRRLELKDRYLSRFYNDKFKKIDLQLNEIGIQVKQTNTYLLTGIVIWDQWKKAPNFDSEYFINETLTALQDNIKLESNKPRNIIRVLGLSGLGKTRLVFETFKNESELKNKIIYCDVAQYLSTLKQYLPLIKSEHKIIIADNCGTTVVRDLEEIILSAESNLTLIAIDFETRISDVEKPILLKNDMLKDITYQILKNKYSSQLSDHEIRRIAEFSDGFPQMAVLFANASLQNNIDLTRVLDDNILQKLIWGRLEPSDTSFKVIKACSIFTSLGMKEGSEDEGKYIAENICEISWKDFYRICKEFMERGIIEPRGNRIIVKPPPLAISLAGRWWKEFPQDGINTFLDDLGKKNLSKQLCDRLGELGHIEEAKEVVDKLCGSGGVFRNAEVLNTELGSRLFRSIVTANPEATVNALMAVFGDKNQEYISRIIKGRRNLVWALESLCFDKNSFSRAAKILYAFAVSENETWANNATNQFIHLYQLGLPGTTASFIERMEIIQYGLDKKDLEYRKIAVKAMGRGLLNDRFSRTGGAENQGVLRQSKDFEITDWSQVVEYWELILLKYKELILEDMQNIDEIKPQLLNGVRFLYRDGMSERVTELINRILDLVGNNWNELLSEINFIIKKKYYRNDKDLEMLNSIVIRFEPKTFKDKLYYFVVKTPFDEWKKAEDGKFIDPNKVKAEKFAEDVVDKISVALVSDVKQIFEGELNQGFNFGYKLGELDKKPNLFIERAIQVLKSINQKNRNPEVLGGYLSAMSDRVMANSIIDRIAQDDDLFDLTFYLTRVTNSPYSQIIKLLELTKRRNLPISYMLHFKYGRSLDLLMKEEINEFCLRLLEFGFDGKLVALNLIHQYCYTDKEKWTIHYDLVKKILASENLLISNNQIFEIFSWQNSIESMLKLKQDSDLTKKIVLHIIEFCSDQNFSHSHDAYVKNLMHFLFQNYFEDVIDHILEGLIGDYLVYFHLKNMIGNKNGNWGYDGILFENSKIDGYLNKLYVKYPSVAPERLINMTPLIIRNGDLIDWHPQTKYIIDNYGFKKEVLNNLSSNMGSFGSTGSSIPYLNEMDTLVVKLIGHKISEVNSWAIKEHENYVNRIKAESIEEAEWNL